VANNLKAIGNAFHMYVPSVLLRKPGCAGLSANGTPKIFNPTVEDDHHPNMRLWQAGSRRKNGWNCKVVHSSFSPSLTLQTDENVFRTVSIAMGGGFAR
jgi:hypothetical protein